MFHVTFMTEDKRLGEVLAVLSGKVHNLEWKHITNATVKGGRVVAKNGGGSLSEAAYHELAKRKEPFFTPDIVKAIMEELGGSPKSVSNYIHTMTKKRMFKRVGSGRYAITKR